MKKEHFDVLDGWRGLSILIVLAGHLLPLGPKAWHMNVAAGLFGMVIFFNLSGFLITHFLLNRPDILDFMIRRLFRILPLAWLYMGLVLYIDPVSSHAWWAHFLFYANYPPKPLITATDHLWSLCVEIHFYLGIALLAGIFKKRGLMMIPLLCLGFTLLRVFAGMHYSVITHFRVDEILAGATLALIHDNKLGSALRIFVARGSAAVLLVLLLLASHPDSGFIQYLRPYFAALLVGSTLFNRESMLVPALTNRVLAYIASISYALYIIHPFLMTTWLGSGDLLQKYAKRPLLLTVLFVSAHVSTFYYEKRWMEMGRWLSEKLHMRIRYEYK